MLTAEQERLAVENIKLAYYVAKRFESTKLPYEDAAGYAMIGLVKASKKFDKHLGFKFSSLAVISMQNEILRPFRKQRFEENLTLDQPLSEDGSDRVSHFVEMIPSNESELGKYIDLYNALEILNDREKFIIYHYYALNGCKEMTQIDIAKHLGVSRTRVQQIENEAKTKLRRYLKGEN